MTKECVCGRSPTGECNGWHLLEEGEYRETLAQWELDEYRKLAETMWFSGGSCTGGKPE